MGFLVFVVIFLIGYPSVTTKIDGFIEGFGAQEAGLIENDRIVAVDGERVEYLDDLQYFIQTKRENSTVAITFLRADKEHTVDVEIRTKEIEDSFGKKRSVGLLGVTFGEVVDVRYGPYQSFLKAAENTKKLTLITYTLFGRLLSGRLSFKDSVAGPLGILDITSKAVQVGLVAVLHMVAVLSISLAIFNLLPFPLLDGGHIVFLGIEKIRKKPLSVRVEQVITHIGLTMIIALALFATYNDLMRMIGDKVFQFFK